MSETPNGRIATPLLCWFRYVLYVLGYFLLKPWPLKIKSLLIRMSLQMMSLKYEFSLLNILEPFCLGEHVLKCIFTLVSQGVERIISDSGLISSKELFVEIVSSQKFETRNKMKLLSSVGQTEKPDKVFILNLILLILQSSCRMVRKNSSLSSTLYLM